MITARQCAMARAGLDITVRDLARMALVGVNTVVRFENGSKSGELTVKRIKAALEAAGAKFTSDDREFGVTISAATKE